MGRGSAKGRSPKNGPGGKKASARRRLAKKRSAKAVRRRRSPSAAPDSEAARLASELNEALQRQAATADILKVIANSPANVQPVFDTIAESAKRLLGSHTAVVTRVIDGVVHFAAGTAVNEAALHGLQGLLPYPLSSRRIHARVARTGKLAFNVDIQNSDRPESVKEYARAIGWNSMLVVPMLREGIAIGTIGITRREAGSFDENTIDLLKTFADQAVIAVENARLFNETKEALERQTATADILKVIASSPDDVQPVFDAIAERAKKLVDAHATTVFRFVDDMARLAAFTPVSKEADAVLRSAFPIPIAGDRQLEMTLRGELGEIIDTESEMYAHLPIRNLARARGFRSRLSVPLKTDSGVIGAISVTRTQPGRFAEHHVKLLQTFADQAVIAIQNVRLFNETREALERQTATAEILKVIANSRSDVQPVFEAIAEQSNRLLNGLATAVYRVVDDTVHLMSFTPVSPAADAHLKTMFPIPLADLVWGPFVRNGQVFSVADTEHETTQPRMQDISRRRGWRSSLYVPLLQDGRLIGAISVTRREAGAFADDHVQLLRTFADQAAIAIENARLFNEVRTRTADLQESLQQLTATSEVLRVISSSSGDLQPVFKIMLVNALEICEASYGNMLLWNVDGFEAAELHNSPANFADLFKRGRLVPPPETALGRVVATKQVAHIPDILAESGGVRQSPLRIVTVESLRARTLLAVPMLREKELVGVIVIYRQEVRPFSEKQIELVTNFADQAVIAIENARLLNELRMRTTELSQSLDDLRAAQDRLVQTEKLASLGQLTAGIAHEIKNPLNFVNNFSALSAELTDELNDLLQRAGLTDKMREEVDELTRLLKENLEKVEQHGKRADSIVKNMLLHSREGSGEQRSTDVNALVDESLNLAYHGARAEKAGFNITLQRDFDAGAGTAELFPQEITRALLNLISNGFYAATRRKSENGQAEFEPTLLATTRSRGNSVEIRIRDNGTGISPEVKEKMFNPFFTTKPAGEGTGLGLSMTHDIVVKQHGGRIDVEVRPGEYTEFIVVLPRAKSAHKDR